MKFPHAIVLAGGFGCTCSFAADGLGAVPESAQSFFNDGVPSLGCGGVDFACQCQQQARIFATVEEFVSRRSPFASYRDVIIGASSGKQPQCRVAWVPGTYRGASLGSQVSSGSGQWAEASQLASVPWAAP